MRNDGVLNNKTAFTDSVSRRGTDTTSAVLSTTGANSITLTLSPERGSIMFFDIPIEYEVGCIVG